ncbi:unnamed protein product, partial [Rotaria sp. Silwood2]
PPLAKARLDYEWDIRTVYMDDYPLLLDVAAPVLHITHRPSAAKRELNAFYNKYMPSVCNLLATKIDNIKGTPPLRKNLPLRMVRLS